MNPLSLTSGIRFVNLQTNAAVQGRWLYNVDGSEDRPCILPPLTGSHAVTDEYSSWYHIWPIKSSLGKLIFC